MLITKDPVDMGFGLDLKISGMCRPVDLRWQSSSFCMWQTALSSSPLTPDLRQKGVSFAWNGRVGYRTWRFCSWLSGSPLGCEGPLPWRKLPWKLSKSPLLYIKVDFFQQCKGLKKNLPFLSIICSDINYIDGVLLVSTSYRNLQMQLDLMCHLSSVFTFHSPSGTLMYSIFLLLLCSEKIVKDGHL